MRIGGTFLALALLFGASYFVVTALKGRQSTPDPAAAKPRSQADASSSESESVPNIHAAHGQNPGYFPKVSETGPWPRIQINLSELDFGRMEMGTASELVFEIRNDGEAELEFSQGTATCPCSLREVNGNRVAPGATALVTAVRTCTSHADLAAGSLEIRTNDPEHRSIKIPIIGTPVERFRLMPNSGWDFGEISESDEATFTGFVGSGIVKDLAAEKLVYDESRMEVKIVPLSAEASKVMKPLSGFGVEIRLKPGLPVGIFQYPLEMTTSAPERLKDGSLGGPAVLRTMVSGRRVGPIRILGADYIAKSGTVALGSFDAAEGKKVRLTMMVRNAPEEGLRFMTTTSEPAGFTMRLLPEFKTSGTTTRYQVELEYPGGEERVTKTESDPGWVKIKTNHPLAAELELKVCFCAF